MDFPLLGAVINWDTGKIKVTRHGVWALTHFVAGAKLVPQIATLLPTQLGAGAESVKSAHCNPNVRLSADGFLYTTQPVLCGERLMQTLHSSRAAAASRLWLKTPEATPRCLGKETRFEHTNGFVWTVQEIFRA